MKSIRFNRIAVTFIFMITSFVAFAQTETITHTVNKGETIDAIAKEYGVSKDAILEANPVAKILLSPGMVLNIPVSKKAQKKQMAEESTMQVNKNKEQSPEADESDFSAYGVSYFASFKSAGTGYYMFGGDILNDAGWGINLQYGMNYGLVDSDFAGLCYLAGPAFAHAMNDAVCLSASLDFMGTHSGVPTGKINYNGKLETELKFNWGFALMPKIHIKLGKFVPFVSVNMSWAKGADRVGFGFQAGLGIHL